MFNPNTVVAKIFQTPALNNLSLLLARGLLAYIFIVSGWGKIAGYSATVGYMEAMGVPGGLLPLVILLELGGGLAILLGLQTRLVALALAVFSLLTAFMFHGAPEDAVNLMKNLAISGGFLLLVLQGAGKLSLDHLIEK